MKVITRYQAFDGQEFETAELCREHEAKHVEMRLVGLTIDQVRAALTREDIELSDAIEEIGKRCATARRDAGDLRRRRKADAPAPTNGDAETEEQDHYASAPESNEARGRRNFKEGLPGIVPDDLKGDKRAADEWLMGWDYESVAAGMARNAA